MLEPSQVYQLPNLLALLPKKPGGDISPHFKEAENEFNSWVSRTVDQAGAKVLYRLEMPLFVSLAFPLASSRELLVVLYYLTMSYLVEVMTDGFSSAEAERSSQLWCRALREEDDGNELHHPFIILMRRELVSIVKSGVDQFHWPQFIATNEHLAESMVEEAIKRETHPYAVLGEDIKSYMDLRRRSIGVTPLFVLAGSIRRVFLSDEVLAHPVVHEMKTAAVDAAALSNDIYSFKKEYLVDGASHNIITALKNDPKTSHLDLQERINYAGELCSQAFVRFEACRKKLPSFNQALDQQMASYADGLLDWIIGNVEWSMVAPRYSMFLNDVDRKDNIMRLDLDTPHRDCQALRPDGLLEMPLTNSLGSRCAFH